MNGNSVNSAMAIWLGFGSTYCGTLKIVEQELRAADDDTATRMMTAISSRVRLPRRSAERDRRRG